MQKSRATKSTLGIFVGVLACGLALGGCSATPPDELDPAATLGEDEWWDEGPPAGEEAESGDDTEDVGSLSSGVTSAPFFQLPFPCGQVWAGQTRSNHSPVNSVDFNRADDTGDTVVASAAGKVTRVANEGNTSYGRWIEIDHGNGYRSRYAHLNSQLVSVGQSVNKGQKIGTVGNTGGSTGPHLHYEVRKNGVAIKPVFNGATAFFYGTKNYTSKNSCGGGGGGGGSDPAAVIGKVNTSGAHLTVRSGPSTSSTAVDSVPDGAEVKISCQKLGTSVTGTYGTSKLWDFIGNGYVSDAYVSTGSDGQVAKTCP
ncbi:MAG: peptidoglycan DD-metalloendopeptidase family protein [Polyangiaceae bacterium]|nr:peptidoglycan DD-metalloendopeptidase family protein [Polyangiaceae bacterium]